MTNKINSSIPRCAAPESLIILIDNATRCVMRFSHQKLFVVVLLFALLGSLSCDEWTDKDVDPMVLGIQDEQSLDEIELCFPRDKFSTGATAVVTFSNRIETTGTLSAIPSPACVPLVLTSGTEGAFSDLLDSISGEEDLRSELLQIEVRYDDRNDVAPIPMDYVVVIDEDASGLARIYVD